MKKFIRASLAITLSFIMRSEAFAIGSAFIGNEVTSARAAGAGYVGVAGQNNDPTAVYTNPAAMTSLRGTQITVGMHLENLHGSYKDNSGNETKARVTNVVVPNFSLTQSYLDGKLSAGLSSQSPFGLETHWGGNSSLRYVATDSRLGMVDIMPAVAYQVHPMVSFGLGADYVNVTNAQLDKHVNNNFADYVVSQPPFSVGAPVGGSPDAVASLRGSGADWGYHAGITIQPNERHAVGITYHSKVNVRINGSETLSGITGAGPQAIFGGSTFSTSANTDIVLPASVQLGYAYKPTEKWILETDASWYHWSDGRDINVRFPAATQAQQALLGNMGGYSNKTVLDAHDAWSANAGVNYKATERLQVRGGAWYEPWVVPEANFSPAFLDLARYGVSTGMGYAITENVMIDVAYTAVFTHNRTINNSVGTTSSNIPATGIPALGVSSPDVSGTYSNFANLIALNFTYRFGRGK